jgi:hypothetical protein
MPAAGWFAGHGWACPWADPLQHKEPTLKTITDLDIDECLTAFRFSLR